MKSLFIAFFVVLFVSCNSDDDGPVTKDYVALNEQEIIDYMAANGLNNANRTSSGLYYIIDEIGAGADITATSDVSLRFRGLYTNGTLLDETTESGITINLQNTIAGLTEGLQYFQEGGRGTLLVPSHLAFGSEDYNGIPGGSVLIFEIEIIDYVADNELEILKFIEDNDLNAVKSESGSGLYYVIEEQGTGENPTENSNVTVAYKGYFTDGEVFDESDENGVSFNLNQVILGWTEGMQFFKEGGSGKLLIPSSIAYGKYGRQTIPGGAVLIFDVNLKSVN
jgi:FKBP-type peptidyl-prolyl cis-trans isomerase